MKNLFRCCGAIYLLVVHIPIAILTTIFDWMLKKSFSVLDYIDSRLTLVYSKPMAA